MENGRRITGSACTSGRQNFTERKCFCCIAWISQGSRISSIRLAAIKALKTLRARSFYLDILMEHLVDTALSKVGLSRANCIYCGGGHAYLLLPNTERAKLQIEDFETMANGWFMDWFGTALYVAGGYAPMLCR